MKIMMNSLTSANWRPTIFILLCGLQKPMVIPAKAGIQEGRGWKNVGRGLVPRWGRGGEWQTLPCQFGA